MLVKATLPLVGNKKHSLIHNQHKRPNKFLSQFRQHSLPQNRSSCDSKEFYCLKNIQKDPYNVIKLKSLQNHNTMRANILFPGSYAGRMSQLLLTILRMKLFMLTFVVNTGVGQLTSGWHQPPPSRLSGHNHGGECSVWAGGCWPSLEVLRYAELGAALATAEPGPPGPEPGCYLCCSPRSGPPPHQHCCLVIHAEMEWPFLSIPL